MMKEITFHVSDICVEMTRMTNVYPFYVLSQMDNIKGDTVSSLRRNLKFLKVFQYSRRRGKKFERKDANRQAQYFL